MGLICTAIVELAFVTRASMGTLQAAELVHPVNVAVMFYCRDKHRSIQAHLSQGPMGFVLS